MRYVYRDGKIVEKPAQEFIRNLEFPTPMISRMEAFEFPVTGKEISTWREREADMKAVDAYDPRDLPKDHVHSRGRAAQAKEADNARRTDDTFEWRDP